jgi:PAS domain S-box-containing protein
MDLHKVSYEKLWETLWEHSVSGLALVAEDGLFLRVNPAFCRIVEYTEHELRSRKFQSITHPDDVSADEEMARDLSDGRISSYDMAKRYITKTGTVRWISLRGTRIALDDGGFAFFLSQITLHVPVESALPLIPIKARFKPWVWIATNWMIIAAILSAIAIITAGVIDRLSAHIHSEQK